MPDNLDIFWELLYDEDFEKTPDPNLPENQVRGKVLREQRAIELKRFRNGHGKPLFEMWEKKIKRSILSLLQDPRYRQCNCPATQQILQIASLTDIWLEAEQAIREE